MGLPHSVTTVFLCNVLRIVSFSHFVKSVPDFSVFLLFYLWKETVGFFRKLGARYQAPRYHTLNIRNLQKVMGSEHGSQNFCFLLLETP